MKGLSTSIKMEKEFGDFTRFQVDFVGLFASHLQYVDDALFFGEASMTNLWTLNTTMCCFDLASGL